MIANIFKSRLADNIDQPTFVKIILVLPKFLLVSYLYNFLCINILLKEKARSIFFYQHLIIQLLVLIINRILKFM